MVEEVRKQKLEEGQKIGELVLLAEARLGELLNQMPKATTNHKRQKLEIPSAGKFLNDESESVEIPSAKKQSGMKKPSKLEAAAEAAANKLAFEELAYESGFDVVTDATDYASLTVFPVSNFAETLVYNTSYDNTIYLYDSLPANIVGTVETEDYINILFNTGEMLAVGYDYNFSPTFRFGNNIEIGYNYLTDSWGTAFRGTDTLVAEEADVSVYENALVYQAGDEDTVYFYDGTAYNIANVTANDYYINIYFNTGAVTSIRYTDDSSPDIVFGDDPTVHYTYHYQNGWTYYDTDDLATSADLFEDPADAFATDATLSDIVAPVADVASFNAGNALDVQNAGELVVATAAADSSNKIA